MERRHIAIVSSNPTSYDYALLYASGGHRVSVYVTSSDEGQATDSDLHGEAAAYVRHSLDKFESKGLLKGSLTRDKQATFISFSSDLATVVQGAWLVQECLDDDLDLRTSMLRRLDDLVTDDVILVSCMTSLMPSRLSQDLRLRSRFLVANHIDPLYYLPAMELVPATWTDSVVVGQVKSFLSNLGKKPAVLKKEVPGFLINRVQAMLYGEAYRLVHDGVITGEDCDVLMTKGIGLRYALMGQWEAVYLDASGMYSLAERYGDMVYNTQRDLQPALPMTGAVLGRIQDSVQCVAGPVEDIPARRTVMEDRIASLIKLKKDLDQDDSKREV